MANGIAEALASLAGEAAGQTTRVNRRLPEAREATPIPDRLGSAKATDGQSGGGIAGPLTETAYADRTFHPETTITTTDGLFVLKVKPVKTISFADATGAPVKIEFKRKT